MAALIPRPNYPPYGGGEDAGREEADKLLIATEKKVHKVYTQAAQEMKRKADDYLAEFVKQDRERAILVEKGELDMDDWLRWRRTHILQGRRWYEMAETLATDMTNSNLIATNIINGSLPDVFATGYNYALYQGEIGGGFKTSFTLYDRDAVERLIAEEPDLLPVAKLKTAEDISWNKKKINSSMLQGIMQGERIEEIAKRMAASVAEMNEKVAIRNARTAYTSAENGGRYNCYRRLKAAGVDLTIEWCATLDSRTRHSHRIMDGQRRDVDEPFEFWDEIMGDVKILWPAQVTSSEYKIPPSMIWNCRCTLLSWVKGFEENRELKAAAFPDEEYESYTDWKYAKQKEEEERRSQPRVNPDNPSYGYATDFHSTDTVRGNTREYQSEPVSRKLLTFGAEDAKMETKGQSAIRKAFTITETTDVDDVVVAVIANHKALAEFTPASMKAMLEELGFTTRPLGKRSQLSGIPFEEGGGYRIDFLGNGYFQYHPELKSHHKGAYWRISSSKRGDHRYDMDGNIVK